MSNIKIFQNKKIRSAWNKEEKEQWNFFMEEMLPKSPEKKWKKSWEGALLCSKTVFRPSEETEMIE